MPELSPQQERILRLRAEGLGLGEIAQLMDGSEQTVKNHLHAVYQALDASSLVDALRAMGWLVVPGEPLPAYEQCSFIARCGRRAYHRGQHGGFRSVLIDPR